ncbi:MAG TPA: hypothetical protein VFP06_22185 [Acidimicrobiales bacterium]|nr:hypothetical protein [Acidimicrobiales bacterium]
MSSKNAKHSRSGGRGRDAQLSLIETPRAWRLDEHTREVGRAGVARAREALRAGRRPHTPDPSDHGARRRRTPASRTGRTAA